MRGLSKSSCAIEPCESLIINSLMRDLEFQAQQSYEIGYTKGSRKPRPRLDRARSVTQDI